MFKFLRKYNTWILAVGGTLLMIAFLIPQAIQSCSQRLALSSSTSATVGERARDVSPVEWQQVQEEVNALQQMARAIGSSAMFLDPVVGTVNDPDRWFLLTYEAEQAGLVGNRPAGLTDEQLLQTASLFQISPAVMSRTYAKINAVNRLIDLYRRSTMASDNRARRFADHLMHEVVIQTVAINADAENSSYEPSDEEIAEQFEKYKDVLPGEGEDSFGYKLPNRFKLEWLEIPAEPVRTAIANSEQVNGIALRRHWAENANQRGIPAVERGGEIPAIVRDDMLDQLTKQKLDEIARFAYDQLRMQQQQLEQRDGRYILPDDWSERRLDLATLAEQVRDRFAIELPAYEAVGDRWLAIPDLAELGDVSLGRTDRFGQSLNLQGLLNLSPEFGGNGTANIQTGVAGPPLRLARDNSVYLFRVTDSDLSRVAHSADEVREAVVEDLRRKAAFESLLASQPTIEQLAEESGLVAVSLDWETDVSRSTRVARYNPQAYQIQKLLRQQGQGAFSIVASSVPGLGQDDDVIDRIVEYAMGFDRTITDFSTIPESERIFTVPSEKLLALVVVRLMEQRPLSEERYQTMVADGDLQILMISEQFEQGLTIQEAFTLEALVERHNFKRTGRTEDAAAADAMADASSDVE